MTIPSITASSPNVKAARAAIEMFASNAVKHSVEECLIDIHPKDCYSFLVAAPSIGDYGDYDSFVHVQIVVQAADTPTTAAEVAHAAMMDFNLQIARAFNGTLPPADRNVKYDAERVNKDRLARARKNSKRGGRVESQRTPTVDEEAQRWKDHPSDKDRIIDERRTPGE